MSSIEMSSTAIRLPVDDIVIDDAELAAVALLARYSGRTLDAYLHDLRGFFQWASDNNLAVLAATRPHIELYRSWMEERGLAASTMDRRLSTSAASTASRTSTVASRRTLRSMCAAHKYIPTLVAWTAPSSGCSCSPRSITTATTPRSPCCSASTVCA